MLSTLKVLIILLILQKIECKKKLRPLYFVTTKFDFNAKYLNDFYITINPGNTSLNILMDIGTKLTDIWCKGTIYIWEKNKSKYRQIVSYDLDMCQHLQRFKTDSLNLLNAWTVNFFKFGNLTRNCPMAKNLYYIENFKPDKDSIPPFTPAGKCRLAVEMYTKKTGIKESIGNCEFDIELK